MHHEIGSYIYLLFSAKLYTIHYSITTSTKFKKMSDNIPLEIQLDIMNRLPVKTVLQLRSVSKTWKENIDSQPFFRAYSVKESSQCLFNLTFDQGYKGFMSSVDRNLTITPFDSHLNLASLMPVGSSSGITCFIYAGNIMALIWNPSIRKSVVSFIPYFSNQIECSKICYGFGVRPDTLDPTIVKVSYPIFKTGFWFVSVFSLNNLSWTRLADFHLPRPSIRLKRKSQAVVGRFIYWAGTERLVSERGLPYKDYTLISFDMITRQFHVIEIPSLLKVVMPVPFYVSELGNSVVMSGMVMTTDPPLFCAWRLNVDGASVTSFRNLFAIPTAMVNKLVGFTSDESPIVEANVGHILGHSLFFFDREVGTFVSLGIEGNAGTFFIAPYKESLILNNLPDRALLSMLTVC